MNEHFQIQRWKGLFKKPSSVRVNLNIFSGELKQKLCFNERFFFLSGMYVFHLTLFNVAFYDELY